MFLYFLYRFSFADGIYNYNTVLSYNGSFVEIDIFWAHFLLIIIVAVSLIFLFSPVFLPLVLRQHFES